MGTSLRRAALAAACVSALVLAGCGRHVAPGTPVTWAPADTPYLIANFKPIPEATAAAWENGAMFSSRIRQSGEYAKLFGDAAPEVAKVLDAVQAELADVHSRAELAHATGLAQPALFAIYGVGSLPVARYELDSPDAFKAFWTRVEKRAGIAAPTATVDGQAYWQIGGASARVRLLVAVEDKQVVATIAPSDASPDVVRRLLGLTKPAHSAADRLARIDSQHKYIEASASGFVDPPKLVASVFNRKDAVTQAVAKAIGVPVANAACASEYRSLAEQVPLVTGGMHAYTASTASGSIDVQLSPALLGALTALKQPVPGMAAKQDASLFDVVLALPLEKWQAFIKGRAEAAGQRTYQCPGLQSLNTFAKTAANPPVQMPPEAASLLGFRLVLDKWEEGPRIAGRVLVASSDPAALAKKMQQTLPQFALKTIPDNGKPVAFELPPQMQRTFGAQGWVAADAHALAIGAGEGADGRLRGMLTAPAGDGERLLRMHFDGRMYGVLGQWFGSLATSLPSANPAQVRQQAAAFEAMGKLVKSADVDVKLDDAGLHFEGVVEHR